GLMGMPRRIYTYQPGLGLSGVNLVETIGAYVFAIGIVLTLVNVVRSRASGKPADPNPWHAASLEWLPSSPPPPFDFEYIPVVWSREPLWDGSVGRGPALDEARLTALTSPLDSTLERAIDMPEDNIWPVVASLTLLLGCGAFLVSWYGVAAVLGALTLLAVARWLWPFQRKIAETEA